MFRHVSSSSWARQAVFALSLLFAPLLAHAQVLQNGTVTPGHPAAWTTNGVIQDGGASTAGFINTLGITGTGLPFCINSAAITGPYQEFCLGLTSTTATITLQNYGGASAAALNFNINGTTYAFPYTVGGITGPATTVVNDLACWNNLIGTLLKDCGVLTNPLGVASGGTGVTALGAGIANNGTNPGLTIDPGYIRGFIGGLTLSNDSGTPNTVIDTAAGVANSDDNTTLMKIASAFTKAANTAWAVGSGNGCLDSGSFAATTWYHLFVIERTDTNVVDELCSTSATSPSLPSGYTKKRRIGSFETDGSTHILAFTQVADTFLWAAPVTDVAAQAIGTSALTPALSVPLGVSVQALFNATIGNNSLPTDMTVNSTLTAAQATSSGNVNVVSQVANANGSAMLAIWTNTSAQVRFIAGVASSIYTVNTQGWVDPRGRFN